MAMMDTRATQPMKNPAESTLPDFKNITAFTV
jgi:hypothetical protein